MFTVCLLHTATHATHASASLTDTPHVRSPSTRNVRHPASHSAGHQSRCVAATQPSGLDTQGSHSSYLLDRCECGVACLCCCVWPSSRCCRRTLNTSTAPCCLLASLSTTHPHSPHAALAWLLLEGVVRVLLGEWLYSLVYPVGAPLHSKGQKQASKDVTTAAVNLVSIIHVAVAVSAAAN